MTLGLGFIESATRLDVTDSPIEYEVPNAVDESRNCIVLCSDTTIHISRWGPADGDSTRVPANTVVTISLFGADVLSIVKADGADDGSAWLTKSSG